MKIQCTSCSQDYPEDGFYFRCSQCGGVYDIQYPLQFNADNNSIDQSGIWRYRHTFGLPEQAPLVTLGEGNTPLIWIDVAGREVGLKCEFLNPTGSFKDRGSALIASFLVSRGVKSLVEDSSGNAGASIAAYAARAGLKARIFIPDSASGPKRRQIEAYGAELVHIMGPRSNTSKAVQRAGDQGAVYASHAYLPFNLPGYATLAYELYEQVGEAPGAVVLPVGQGGLLLGLGRGFDALYKAGLISHIPTLVGIQARVCAPLWALREYGPAGLQWVAENQTLAEGIRVLHPLRGDAVLDMINRYKGILLAVDEEQIESGWRQLSRRGFYVEQTSAVVWSGMEEIDDQVSDPIILVLTGSGLKSKENH